jgi:hypothetical protein
LVALLSLASAPRRLRYVQSAIPCQRWLGDVLADPLLKLHDATGALGAGDNCSSLPAGWIPQI